MKFSYFLVICCLLIVGVLANTREEVKAKAIKAIRKCKTQTKASSGDVRDYIRFSPARTRAGKCLRSCVKREFGITDRRGKLIRSVTLDLAADISNRDPELMRQNEAIVDACMNLAIPSDRCESASMYHDCLRRQSLQRKVDFLFIDIGMRSF